MALTRDFKETIHARAEIDPEFRAELLKQGIDCMLLGDLDTGKAVLRDFINATVGFAELSAEEKWKHSHRGMAFRAMLAWLRESA